MGVTVPALSSRSMEKTPLAAECVCVCILHVRRYICVCVCACESWYARVGLLTPCSVKAEPKTESGQTGVLLCFATV